MGDSEAGRLERLRGELERLVRAAAQGAEAVIQRPQATPGSLHNLHRDLRHLRTGLAVWRELVPRSQRDPLATLDRRLRRLARLVGEVRDRDVAVDLLGSVEAFAHRRRDQERLERYRGRLRDDARTGRELLRALLRSETDGRLFDGVAAFLAGPVGAVATRAVFRRLSEHRSRGHEKLVTAHRKARKRPSMDRLHRLRIRVRRLRQINNLAGAVDPATTETVAGSLRSLQQGLGRLHDLDVLFERLDPTFRETRWARALRKERKRQRRRIVSVLDTGRPRRTAGPEAPAPAR